MRGVYNMTRTKVKCDICGQEISKSNITKHMQRHEEHPESFELSKYKLDHDGLECQYCGRLCKSRNSLCNHERLCKQNPDRQVVEKKTIEGFNNKGRTPWNKGLSKYNDERVAQNCKSIKAFYDTHAGSWSGKQHTEDSKRKIALSVAGNTRGNRSKKGYYKNIYCGSSYELAYVIYNIDHNIPFSKCNRYYEYEFEGSKHLYFPDFELQDGTIVEIKGYHTSLVDIKAAAVKDRPIIILYKEDLMPYIEYVCTTYNVTETTLHTLFDK